MTDQALSGRRVVITGAAQGLGRALAMVAADRGAEVVLLGRGAIRLSQASDVINTRTGGPNR